MQGSCSSCRVQEPKSAGLPEWRIEEPAESAQILDVRKVHRILNLGEDEVLVEFTSTRRRRTALPCTWGALIHAGKAVMKGERSRDVVSLFHVAIFQLAVEDGVIRTGRLRAVSQQGPGQFQAIEIEPERRSGLEYLYGVWLPEATDHEYVFLRDCERFESEGSVLSPELVKRISSLRWRCKLRGLFTRPFRI
jgi:hypothetical protein